MRDVLMFLLGAGFMFFLLFILSALLVSGRVEDSERRLP